MDNESLIEFPCSFPIKIMGENSDEFEQAIVAIFNSHCDDLSENAFSSRLSKNGTYKAMTVTIMAKKPTTAG